MIQPEPIGLWNTGFPMALLGVLAVLVPWLLAKKDTRSQRHLAVVIGISAGLLLIIGGIVIGATYAGSGVAVIASLQDAPFATSMFFLRLSGYAAILWVPILALVWFGMAQGVEKRRGEDAAKLDRS